MTKTRIRPRGTRKHTGGYDREEEEEIMEEERREDDEGRRSIQMGARTPDKRLKEQVLQLLSAHPHIQFVLDNARHLMGQALREDKKHLEDFDNSRSNPWPTK